METFTFTGKWTAVGQNCRIVEPCHQGDWRLGLALQRENLLARFAFCLECREIGRSAVPACHLWCVTSWTLEGCGAAQLVQTFTHGARTMRIYWSKRREKRSLGCIHCAAAQRHGDVSRCCLNFMIPLAQDAQQRARYGLRPLWPRKHQQCDRDAEASLDEHHSRKFDRMRHGRLHLKSCMSRVTWKHTHTRMKLPSRQCARFILP